VNVAFSRWRRLNVTLRMAVLTVRRLLRRIPIALGHEPNIEWFRVRLNPVIVLDHTCAQAAIAEIERCLRIQRAGQLCRRLTVRRQCAELGERIIAYGTAIRANGREVYT
jgi:hypothetical protein